jgi:hypothetical protein
MCVNFVFFSCILVIGMTFKSISSANLLHTMRHRNTHLCETTNHGLLEASGLISI